MQRQPIRVFPSKPVPAGQRIRRARQHKWTEQTPLIPLPPHSSLTPVPTPPEEPPVRTAAGLSGLIAALVAESDRDKELAINKSVESRFRLRKKQPKVREEEESDVVELPRNRRLLQFVHGETREPVAPKLRPGAKARVRKTLARAKPFEPIVPYKPAKRLPVQAWFSALEDRRVRTLLDGLSVPGSMTQEKFGEEHTL